MASAAKSGMGATTGDVSEAQGSGGCGGGQGKRQDLQRRDRLTVKKEGESPLPGVEMMEEKADEGRAVVETEFPEFGDLSAVHEEMDLPLPLDLSFTVGETVPLTKGLAEALRKTSRLRKISMAA